MTTRKKPIRFPDPRTVKIDESLFDKVDRGANYIEFRLRCTARSQCICFIYSNGDVSCYGPMSAKHYDVIRATRKRLGWTGENWMDIVEQCCKLELDNMKCRSRKAASTKKQDTSSNKNPNRKLEIGKPGEIKCTRKLTTEREV